MIRIAEITEEILEGDEIALEALRAGILNLSAYAKQILPKIESKTLQPVRKGSVVVALSRSAKNIGDIPPLKPKVVIQDLSIKSPLFVATFERTAKNLEKVSELPKAWFADDFFTITEGVGEITLISSEKLKNKLLNYFSVRPKGQYKGLVAVTIRFKAKVYTDVPNMIFTLMSAIAGKRINLMEVISTYTELSFVVRKSATQNIIEVLEQFFDRDA